MGLGGGTSISCIEWTAAEGPEWGDHHDCQSSDDGVSPTCVRSGERQEGRRTAKLEVKIENFYTLEAGGKGERASKHH